MNHWSTPATVGDHLYGLFGQGSIGFRCVDINTGEQTWPESGPGAPATGFGYGSVVGVGTQVLALTERGTLILVDPDPTGYSELGRYRAFTNSNTKCWNSPAISGGRIYVRSTLEAVCLDVAPPQLALTATLHSGRLALTISPVLGGPIDTSRAQNIQVFRAESLSANPSDWTVLTNPATLHNGVISMEDPISITSGQRVYQSRELP
jgi:hypothetical protein